MNCDCLCCWNTKNHRQYGKNHSKRYGSYDYIGLWEYYISLTDPDLAEPHAEGCGFGRGDYPHVRWRWISVCVLRFRAIPFPGFAICIPRFVELTGRRRIVVFQDSVKKGYISDGESCNGDGWSFKSEDAVVDNFLRPAADLSRGLPGLKSFCTNTKAMMSGHGFCRWLKRYLDPSKKSNSPISQAVTSFFN